MKIIIPMAGMGKRMRPHTLTLAKPLIPVAGKPMVMRLVEEIIKVSGEKVEEIAFIIGHFGAEVEQKLLDIAKEFGSKGTIYYQDVPLGTAHAIYCAEKSISGKVVVAFADTLFDAKFKIETENEASIWVQKVHNPELFGVVKLNDKNIITDFIEKPKEFITDLAIIGIYYFKDGDNLKAELKYLLDNNVVVNGEYQLTDALENMKEKGVQFRAVQVNEWLDCGNKEATLYTNERMLELKRNEKNTASSAKIINSVVIEPCFIGENAVIENSVVGPHLSVGENSVIKNTIIKNCIVQSNTNIENAVIEKSMIGNFSKVSQQLNVINIGDYNTI